MVHASRIAAHKALLSLKTWPEPVSRTTWTAGPGLDPCGDGVEEVRSSGVAAHLHRITHSGDMLIA